MVQKWWELSASTTETIKWAGPLVFSLLALWKSTSDSSRAARESSTRARQQYNADLRHWFNEGIYALSDAVQLARLEQVDAKKVGEVISRLSALADQGRLFFPNQYPTLHGQDKESAHRGFRPRILDWLIYSVELSCLIKLTPDTEISTALTLMKRGFTSDAQLAIDPLNLFTTLNQLQDLLKKGEFMEVSQSHQNLVKARAVIDARKVKPEPVHEEKTPPKS